MSKTKTALFLVLCLLFVSTAAFADWTVAIHGSDTNGAEDNPAGTVIGMQASAVDGVGPEDGNECPPATPGTLRLYASLAGGEYWTDIRAMHEDEDVVYTLAWSQGAYPVTFTWDNTAWPENATVNAADVITGSMLTVDMVTENTVTVGVAQSFITSLNITVNVPGEQQEVPVIAVNPTNIDFGTINTGTLQETIVVKNDGTGTLNVTSSGLLAPFTVAPVEEQNITAADSVEYVVTFAPTAEGTYTDTLIFASNDSATPTVNVVVTGAMEVVQEVPQIAVNPASIDFGTVEAGSYDQTMVVKNVGTGTLTVDPMGYAAPFSIAPTTVQNIAAADSVVYTITFAPAEAGNYADTLALHTNDTNNAIFNVVLTGAVEGGPVVPQVVINEVCYDTPGTDEGEFIELKNVGTEAVDLSTLEVVLVNGSDGQPYTTMALTGSLAAGAYFVIGDSYITNADMALDGSIQNGAPDYVLLNVVEGATMDALCYGETDTHGLGEGAPATDYDTGIYPVIVGLSRYPDGVDTNDNATDFVVAEPTPGATNNAEYLLPTEPEISVYWYPSMEEVTEVAFGSFEVPVDESLQFSMKNVGGGELVISDINLDGAAVFAIDATFPDTLEAGQYANVTVTFVTDTEGPYAATLNILNNDANVAIPVTGTATGGGTGDYVVNEGFETWPPAGWILDPASGDGAWVHANGAETSPYGTEFGPGFPYEGDHCAMFDNYYFDEDITGEMITPQFSLAEIDSPTLMFYWWNNDGTYNPAYMVVSTSTNGTDFEVLDTLWTLQSGPEYVLYNHALESDVVKVKLMAWSDYGSKNTYVDAFYIGTPPPILAVEPMALDFQTVAVTDVVAPLTFDISNTGAGTITINDITANAPFSIEAGYATEVNAGETVTISVNLDNSQPGIYADAIHVMTTAGDRDITVAAEIIMVPLLLSENFNGDWSSENPPNGWTIIDLGVDEDPVEWDNNDWHPYQWTSGYNHGNDTQAARVYYSPVEDQDEWLISPAIDLSGETEATLKFAHYYNDETDQNDTDFGYVLYSLDFDPVTMTDPSEATWVQIMAYVGVDSYDYQRLNLTNACGNANVYVAFHYVANNDLGWYIDDVRVSSGAPLELDPMAASISGGAEVLFTATGGVEPYTFTLREPELGTLVQNGTEATFTSIDVAMVQTAHIKVADANMDTVVAVVTINPASYVYHEAFASDVIADSTWILDPAEANNWSWNETQEAAHFYYSPSIENYQHHMQLAEGIDLSAETELYMMVEMRFDDYGEDFDEIFDFMYTSDDGATWTPLFTVNNEFARGYVVANVTDELAGEANVKFDLFMHGANSFNIDNIYVYDIAIMNSSPFGAVEGVVDLGGMTDNSGVQIILDGIALTETTAADGSFGPIEVLGGVEHIIEFNYPNYGAVAEPFTVPQGETVSLDIYMGPNGPTNLTAQSFYDSEVPLTWEPPYIPLPGEIAYDDATYEGYVGIGLAGYNMVTKFDADSYPYELTHVRMNISDSTPFDLVVFEGDGAGLPTGTPVVTYNITPPAEANQSWITIELAEAYTASATFFVGVAQLSDDATPHVGIDRDSDAGRAFTDHGDAGWHSMSDYGADFTGNLAIRCYSVPSTDVLPAHALNMIQTSEEDTKLAHEKWAMVAVNNHESRQLSFREATPSRVTTIDHYIVYYREQGETEWLTFAETFAGDVTTGTITGLTNNVTYEFKVSAMLDIDDNMVETSPSNVASATPQGSATLNGFVYLGGRTDHSGITVSVQNPAEMGSVMAQTAADGSYSLAGVVQGDRTIRFSCPYFIAKEMDLSIIDTVYTVPADTLIPDGPQGVSFTSYENAMSHGSWAAPYLPEPGEIMMDDASFEQYVGLGEGGIAASAFYFEEATTINKIKFNVNADPTTSGIVNVHIFGANTEGMPGEELYGGQFIETTGAQANSFVSHELTTPLVIAAGSTIFIGGDMVDEYIGVDENTYYPEAQTAYAYIDYDGDGHPEWGYFSDVPFQDMWGDIFYIQGTFGIRPVIAVEEETYMAMDMKQFNPAINPTFVAERRQFEKNWKARVALGRQNGIKASADELQPLGAITFVGVACEPQEVAQTRETLIDHYNVYYREEGATEWTLETATEPGIELTGLTNGTTYEAYVVAVYDTDGVEFESAPSTDYDGGYATFRPDNIEGDFLAIDWDGDDTFTETFIPLLQAWVDASADYETLAVIDADLLSGPFPAAQIPTDYKGVFVGAGIYEYINDITTDSEIEQYLVNFLNAGTAEDMKWLYVEGGDVFGYNSPANLGAAMGINVDACEDGTGDLANVRGIGLSWGDDAAVYEYNEDVQFNNYIDHLVPSTGMSVLENADERYIIGIANEATGYRTLGCSFELAGLVSTTDQQAHFDNIIEALSTEFPRGNLQVTVEETNGTPLAGVTVEVRAAGSLVASGLTPDTGIIMFADILGGTYTVHATLNGYTPGEEEALVIDGETEEVTITLDPLAAEAWSEDFESYDTFAVADWDEERWTLVDQDMLPTYGINGVTFPHMEEAMSYIIFDPDQATPAIEGENWDAHGGTQYAASFAAVPSGGVINNDWMISRRFELLTTADPQATLELWVKSVMGDYGLERYRVLISTAAIGSNPSTNPAAFTPISQEPYQEAPVDAWQMVSFDLSAYRGQTIRFAVNCVSSDAFVFMADDFVIRGDDIETAAPVVNVPMVFTEGLEQNYPNPFNPETQIAFNVAQKAPVNLTIYNVKGQKVKTLANGEFETGRHVVRWNGVNENGEDVASGVYFYRVSIGKNAYTKKMVMLK